MEASRHMRFDEVAAGLGYKFDGELKIGGNYRATVRTATQIFVSGQIPRVGDTVVVTGSVGEVVSLNDAQKAAKVCAMRCLSLLFQALGSLDHIDQILRVTVFVQFAKDFGTQFHSLSDEKHTRRANPSINTCLAGSCRDIESRSPYSGGKVIRRRVDAQAIFCERQTCVFCYNSRVCCNHFRHDSVYHRHHDMFLIFYLGEIGECTDRQRYIGCPFLADICTERVPHFRQCIGIFNRY
jgi:enamine deaminase RidA (YjgF/YER057c/UK114 family)